MIESALKALRDEGLIETSSRPEVSVTVGRSLNVQVFPERSDGFYNVKLSRLNLEREHRALTEVREVLPDAIPVAMAFRRMGDLNALITQGVSSKAVREWPQSLTDFVSRYHGLQLQSRPFQGQISIGQREVIASMLESEGLAEIREPVGAWLASERSAFLDSLPAVSQHGDFAVMNLGAANGGYVIFDWEDFGKVWLPGFDVCIFLLDATGVLDGGKDLTAVLDSTDATVADLRGRLLESLGLDARDFPHLLLASLVEFLYLKAFMQYGTPIINTTKRLIREGCTLVAEGARGSR